MKTMGVVCCALAGLLLAGVAAIAQGPGGGMGPGFGEHRPPMERAFGAEENHGRWWNNPRVVERLKLTDEQRKDFDGIFLEHREKLIDLRASLQKAELAMEPLMSDDQPNEAKILAQIDKIAQARADLEKANAAFLLAIRAKLTPEQWKMVKAYRASHEQAGREGAMPPRGNWHPGGPGAGMGHRETPPPPAPDASAPAPGAAPQQ